MMKSVTVQRQGRGGGSGSDLLSSLHRLPRASKHHHYRALTHIISRVGHVCCTESPIAAYYFRHLQLPLWPHQPSVRSENSTHTCPYIYTQRDSTHFFTVKLPTNLPTHQPFTAPLHPSAPVLPPQATSSTYVSTVIPPTNIPFRGPLTSRALNHAPTVTPHTEQTRSTVLSPTEVPTNPMNLHATLSRKDVFKTCLKKHHSVLMSFFHFHIRTKGLCTHEHR
jgi:hypothetical protein